MSSGVKKGAKSKVKKEELYDDDFVDSKPSVGKTSSDKRKRVKKEEEMEIINQTAVKDENNSGGKKREKKTFTLPGQKRDPPDERDPLRIFYESLYKQVPSSDMAAFWLF